MSKKQYGIYIVEDRPKQNGKWGGFKVSVVDSIGKKQGKLYIKSDGRENYQAQPPVTKPKDKDEELEI